MIYIFLHFLIHVKLFLLKCKILGEKEVLKKHFIYGTTVFALYTHYMVLTPTIQLAHMKNMYIVSSCKREFKVYKVTSGVLCVSQACGLLSNGENQAGAAGQLYLVWQEEETVQRQIPS